MIYEIKQQNKKIIICYNTNYENKNKNIFKRD